MHTGIVAISLVLLMATIAPAHTGAPEDLSPPVDTTDVLDGRSGDWAWQPLLEHEGVVFEFIYYSERQSVRDGVVVRLTNTNEYPIRYAFRMVIRTLEREVEEPASGTLAPGEAVTGDEDGLFWTVERGEMIAEIGMRGYRIERKQ